MKKIKTYSSIAFLIIAVTILLLLSGCERKKDYSNLVSDAWSSGESRLPKINMDSREIQELNKSILEKFKDDYIDIDYYLDYRWYRNGDVLSLIIEMTFNGGLNPYYAYNVSISREVVLSKDDILSTTSYSKLDEYYGIVKKAIVTSFCEFNIATQDISPDQLETGAFNSYVAEGLSQAIEEKNVESVEPFLNEKGELCIIASFPVFVGPSKQYACINLETIEVPSYVEALIKAYD